MIDSYEVMQTLIGKIEPTGSTHIDTVRYTNLVLLLDLIEKMIDNISDVSTYKNCKEHSMNKAGLKADEFLVKLREDLESKK